MKSLVKLLTICATLFFVHTSYGQIQISEISDNSFIEVVNSGPSTIDVSNYWLCNRPIYQRLSALTVECGQLSLAPGASVTLSGFNLSASGDELGVYNSSSFGSASAIVDYVIWGNRGGSTRESVAVAAGLWSTGNRAPAIANAMSLNRNLNLSGAQAYTVGTSSICVTTPPTTGCNVSGGSIILDNGLTSTSICVDGVADPLGVSFTQAGVGSVKGYIVTDDLGNILALPPSPPFNLDPAGPGTCYIYAVSYEPGFGGAVVGNNISNLTGCFDLSNFITVVREIPDGGRVTLLDGSTTYTDCAGSVVFDVTHTTTAPNLSYWYIITDENNNILDFANSANTSTLDLSGAPAGVCRVWGWNYRGLSDPVRGESLSTLMDDFCEDVSDGFITVNRLDQGATGNPATACQTGWFEPFNAGTFISNQISGISITGTCTTLAGNRAMIFDSGNATGGDTDLSGPYGKMLIISEDNDGSDPDDERRGGVLSFSFDSPRFVNYIQLVDIEEAGGFVRLTTASGAVSNVSIPARGNASFQQLALSAANVVSMEVYLEGSGAIADFCAAEMSSTTSPCGGPTSTGADCVTYNTDNFDGGYGFWNDGGGDCAFIRSSPTGSASLRLRDNSGQASSTFTNILNFSAVSNLNVEFDFLPVSFEANEDFYLEYSSNGGSSWTVAQQWIVGRDFNNNQSYTETVNIPGPFTSRTVLRFRCDASSNFDELYLDKVVIETCMVSDNDPAPACNGVISGFELNPNNGTPSVSLTEGMVLCAADFQDSEVNITANAQGGHESLVFTIVSPDGTVTNTENFVTYDSRRFWSRTPGNYTINARLYSEDNSNGELCDELTLSYVVESPSVCANTGGGNPGGDCYSLALFENFENGYGTWNDGGTDCRLISDPIYAANGTRRSVRIRDNSGSISSVFSDRLSFANVTDIKVDFNYLPESMETGEDFMLEYSTDNGRSWSLIRSWVSGVDFTNNVAYTESVSLSANFSSSTRLRFRCDATSNADRVYVDEIAVYACGFGGLTSGDNETSYTNQSQAAHTAANANLEQDVIDQELELVTREGENSNQELRLYPNPVSSILNIKGASKDEQYSIISTTGIVHFKNETKEALDVSLLESGTYFLRTSKGTVQRFVKIK